MHRKLLHKVLYFLHHHLELPFFLVHKILQIHLNITEPIHFIEVDELTATERGDGGFGSTNK